MNCYLKKTNRGRQVTGRIVVLFTPTYAISS
jgi:hypothetical protein